VAPWGIVDVKPAPTRATARHATRANDTSSGLRKGQRVCVIVYVLCVNLPRWRPLFPTVRGDVLAATLTQPEKWWYLSELAQFLGTSPSSLHRELKALVAGGILETCREGTRVYFKADTGSPAFPELRGLIDKTAGVVPTLRTTLRPFARRIACAFVYGSVARREEHARSDIDLLVVGDAGLVDLTPVLRKAEARLGREVNVTSYSAARRRLATTG
jgi:predicted nucleotidyltransferase/AraC-like DNA-binding protein